jgi:hypothetical protein
MTSSLSRTFDRDEGVKAVEELERELFTDSVYLVTNYALSQRDEVTVYWETLYPNRSNLPRVTESGLEIAFVASEAVRVEAVIAYRNKKFSISGFLHLVDGIFTCSKEGLYMYHYAGYCCETPTKAGGKHITEYVIETINHLYNAHKDTWDSYLKKAGVIRAHERIYSSMGDREEHLKKIQELDEEIARQAATIIELIGAK